MTIHTSPKSKALLLGLAAATLVLSGCQDPDLQDANPFLTAQWRQKPASYENHVEFVTMNHVVAYEANAIKPGNREFARLRDFVREGSVTSQDEIVIDAARPAGGSRGPVSVARLEILEGEFLQLGLLVTIADLPLSETGENVDQITVAVKRAVAIAPDCSAPQPDIGQKPERTPGCHNTAALSYIIANPRDLLKGRPIGPTDGETASRAVEAYRNPDKGEGQSQPLVFELTTGE
jgi:pilus assembly protein CpaD